MTSRWRTTFPLPIEGPAERVAYQISGIQDRRRQAELPEQVAAQAVRLVEAIAENLVTYVETESTSDHDGSPDVAVVSACRELITLDVATGYEPPEHIDGFDPRLSYRADIETRAVESRHLK